jgi:hypothetical protein
MILKSEICWSLVTGEMGSVMDRKESGVIDRFCMGNQ